MGQGGRDLGPEKVRTSNVLQNMECVESFPLGYVGVCLFCLGWGCFFFLPCSLVSDCIDVTFLDFFSTSYSGESRAKKILSSLWFTVIGGGTK